MLLTLSAFAEYLTRCREEAAPRLLVLGHAAPDGDAVISSLFEGWRLTLSGTPAVPVVQARRLPREVAWLLGDMAPLVRLETEVDRTCPDSRFVLTDHHEAPALRERVVGVVDHHIPAPGTDLTGVDTLIRPVGATVTLVAQRLREQGFASDAGVARLLLGGLLLDTDGLSPQKTTPEDVDTAGWLAAACGEQTEPFYAALQAQLLSETNVDALYRRDYRTYPDQQGKPLLGFAILKVWGTAVPDLAQVRRLLVEDVACSGCMACVAKIMTFTPSGGRGEQICLAAGPAAGRVLDELMALEGEGALRPAPDQVVLPACCPQRGRKRYADHLRQVLAAADGKCTNFP